MYGKGKVIVLSERTKVELNVDVGTDVSPHRKVFVKCERCGEEFKREYRNLHQLHACPTHIVRSDGVKLKWCNKCKVFLPYESFGGNVSRYDKLNSLCSHCLSSSVSRRKMHAKSQIKRKTLEGWVKWAITQKRADCKKYGIECTITADDLLEIAMFQHNRCFYSKVELQWGVKSLYSASLERLIPSLGYTKDNVVLACKAMNWAKNNSSLDEFHGFLHNASFCHPVRLEVKRLHNDAIIPTKKYITDAGMDIYTIETQIIKPRCTVNFNTGLAISPPENYYYTVEGRSSLWIKGIVPCRGIIDSGYIGPLMVAVANNSDIPYEVLKGDRIAQLILHKVLPIDFVEISDFSVDYNQRSNNGFGSTGR